MFFKYIYIFAEFSPTYHTLNKIVGSHMVINDTTYLPMINKDEAIAEIAKTHAAAAASLKGR